MREVKAFEHQVKQDIRQTRGKQHAGIQNHKGMPAGRERMKHVEGQSRTSALMRRTTAASLLL